MALQDFFENLTLIERRTVSDGMGGFTESWVDGATFRGAINMDNSAEMRLAEKQGVTSVYTVIVEKNVPIKYYDVIKRNSNNRYYRITSEADEMQTPAVANVQYKQASAELFTLTNN